ncbi:transposase [Candidatus Binatia bacterium]|nr:transposase [Candidatus Binatia bacterium]MCK6588531.1 hypothetical protein [Polyangiaceae bacterium]
MIDPLDPIRPRRRSIRLRGYDYSGAGAYFVTICAQDRACLFGDVVDEVMRWNDAGMMIREHWTALPRRFPTVTLDEFVVMPNHVHGVVIIHDASGAGGHEGRPYDDNLDVGAPLVGARHDDDADGAHAGGHEGRPYASGSPLGQVIGAFKSMTTVAYGLGVRQFAWPTFRGRLWQRNYYEHIVRNEVEMDRIRRYIAENPSRWAQDRENPACVGAPLAGAEEWEVA